MSVRGRVNKLVGQGHSGTCGLVPHLNEECHSVLEHALCSRHYYSLTRLSYVYLFVKLLCANSDVIASCTLCMACVRMCC